MYQDTNSIENKLIQESLSLEHSRISLSRTGWWLPGKSDVGRVVWVKGVRRYTLQSEVNARM